MLTDAEIDAAKARTVYSARGHHEHNDCIRMAYEWFDAQNTVKVAKKRYQPLKHVMEKWAGRYVSQSDAEVAAILHPRITGKYPNFNLSTQLVLPNDRRLVGIGEALSQSQRESLKPSTYATVEA
jgi:hypothetical protein